MSKKPLKINEQTLTACQETLRTLPLKPKTEYSARESVQELAPQIRQVMAERGYTLLDVARMLAQSGFEIGASTLGSYLRELDASKARKAKPVRSGKSTAKQVASPVVEHAPVLRENVVGDGSVPISSGIVFRPIEDEDDLPIDPAEAMAGSHDGTGR